MTEPVKSLKNHATEKHRKDGEEHVQPPKGPRVDPADPVEEASYESFPASDPPSFNPGTAGQPAGEKSRGTRPSRSG